ncbi:MAG: mechanosensitive ion channel family protein [Spirochaetaceae bacterium]|nr:mechanosensitive ion channel family protein [Spirochaetaceae bacterium]MCF7950838.1 mechanosensitive ion channel family protein [Spirochaetaceae bacterium]
MSIIKVVGTFVILIVGLLIQKLLQKTIDRYVRKYRIVHRRNLAMHKTKTVFVYICMLIGIVLIWGVAIENVWMSVVGMLGLIAIGFVAVWSILSNVVAGMLLFFNQTLRIEDQIELLPDGIKGKVLDVNSFFVILVDEEGNKFHVPNNFFFQKYVKHNEKREPV